MTQNNSNYSLIVNSLLSSKELLINHNNELQITECSSFKNSKKLIPLDLINSQAKLSSRPDIQWLLFGMVNFFAAGLFLTLALSQQISFPLVLTATFTILCLLSVYASLKFKNIIYTYQFKESDINLFSLTGNDLNADQINDFVSRLNDEIMTSSNKHESEKSSIDDYANEATSLADKHHSDFLNHQIENYSEHLDYLHKEGIINDLLLERLQQQVHNKVYGISDTLPKADIVPLRLPVTGT